jgi:hypothetical protein
VNAIEQEIHELGRMALCRVIVEGASSAAGAV